jgi:hypothetical protein
LKKRKCGAWPPKLDIVRSCFVFSAQESVHETARNQYGAASAELTETHTKSSRHAIVVKEDACKTALRLGAPSHDFGAQTSIRLVRCASRISSHCTGMMQPSFAIQIVGGRPMRKQKSRRSQD